MPHLLVIEDDVRIRAAVTRVLGDHGHSVAMAGTAFDGLQMVMSERPDLVILDLGLPDLDGTELLRMIRSVSKVPIIVTTARDDNAEIVATLRAGADDYVTKPYNAEQLDARIGAVLRRGAGSVESGVLSVAELTVDQRARTATLGARSLELTPKEFDLLAYLAARAGEVISKRELMTQVWRMPYGGADKTVDVHLSWLRGKLGESAGNPRFLHTVRGVGVRLAADVPGPDGARPQLTESASPGRPTGRSAPGR